MENRKSNAVTPSSAILYSPSSILAPFHIGTSFTAPGARLSRNFFVALASNFGSRASMHRKNLSVEARSKPGALSRTEFVSLLRAADIAALIETKRPLVRIPPCSLLGRVEILGGAQKMTFIFMADQGQAEQAGMEPPPALARLVDKIFEVSAAHMEVKAARGLRP